MSEPDRIKAAYARRASQIEPGRYSSDRSANAFARRERQRILQEALMRRGIGSLATLEILEIGCGTGAELDWLCQLGADPKRLHGIDLREDAIREAKSRVPDADLRVGDASFIWLAAASLDLAYQATAFSSMTSPQMRERVAIEILRVVRPGGLIVSYDFVWNPRNRDTVGIGSNELRRLFPGLPIEEHRVTLAPPIGRWLGDHSTRLLRWAAAIPVLRTHRLVLIDVPER
jgi:SAM-dependent methyltransferase